MNELVDRLCKEVHHIVASRSENAADLKAAIERGLVLLEFTNTRGGTELGARLDRSKCRLDEADFENDSGIVKLVGHLTVNYHKVEIAATLDLATLEGEGSLRLVGDVYE